MNNIIGFNEHFVDTFILNSIEDFDTTKDNFLFVISTSDKELSTILNRNLIENLKNIISFMTFPLTVVYEPYYVDPIYRDEYYTFYSKKHFGISRNTKRFVFFNNIYHKEDFLDDDENKHDQIEKDLIGMIVIKPTQTIGRMLISPFHLNIPQCYVRTTEFELSVLGKTYTLEAFPFSGQDSEVMTCAEVNIWQIIEYFGCRYKNYRSLLPSEMLELITELSDARLLPSDGLTVEQESHVFKKNGLSPKIYYKRSDYDNGTYFETYEQYPEDPSFEEILHFYVESGIPVLLNLCEKIDSDRNGHERENHSVTCIGHALNNMSRPMKPINFGRNFSLDKSDSLCYNKIAILKSWSNVDGYVIMEDHSAPYQIQNLHNMKFVSDGNGRVYEIESFVVPLYKHIFMAAEDAYEVSISWLVNSEDAIIESLARNGIGESSEIVIRLFMTTSRSYKRFRVSTACSIYEKVFFSQVSYPKFIWVCEYATIDTFNRHKAIGELVIDATASKHSTSIISVRCGDSITYRGPMDPLDNVNCRRDVPLDREFDMFEQNNLKKNKII